MDPRKPPPPPPEPATADEEIPPDPLEQRGRTAAGPPPTIELAIRDALRKGDVKFALTLATSHYRAPLIRFCLAFVHDETTAEDVAQTALTIAAERATEFSGQSTFRTWIFGIARHKALDAAAARQGMPLSAVTDSRWIADAIGPVTGLQKADDLSALEAVLGTLGDEVRALLSLRFREELSYKEIADAFEITEQAARKRMFDALEKIRKLITHQRADFFESK
jgi:RNA polymerase sigma-70 factor, ECF subfamily